MEIGREPNVYRDLKTIISMKNEHSQTARSLLAYAEKKGYLTNAQYRLLMYITNKSKIRSIPSQRKNHKTYVYGITDGEKIKIGMSKNVEKRLAQLQTGCATKLRIAWVKYVGTKREKARILERRIHKEFKKHRLEGEWFDACCLDMLQKFDSTDIYSL